MKPNPYKFWKVTLSGSKKTETHTLRCHGRIETALAEADEEECVVDFDVVKIVIELDPEHQPNPFPHEHDHQPTLHRRHGGAR